MIEIQGKGCTVKVIADSVSPAGKRITTLQLRYWRAIHAEFMTHRVFSRNASSSRAIPVSKMIEQVHNDPAGPIHWGRNQSGMQALEELAGHDLAVVKATWRGTAETAAHQAKIMASYGAHKQIVNRLLEPFQYISVVVTATEWDNFFALRCHPDAQPEIQELAYCMREAMGQSTPKLLQPGEWHLPYVGNTDQSNIQGANDYDLSRDELIALSRKISAARCCRVSYLKHDEHASTIEEDLNLCEKLAGAVPIHASPFEHQASPDELVPCGEVRPVWRHSELHGNFVGWVQYRKLIETSF